MRVLFITSSYPARPADPRGTFIHELARALVEKGSEMTVLAPGAAAAPCREWRDGVQVYRARYWQSRGQALTSGLAGIVPNLRRRPWLAVQIPPLIVSLTWHAVRLARYVDVIHAHWVYPSGIAALAAARWHNKPLVMTSHGGDLNRASGSPALTALCKQLARRADACIGVSEAMAAKFVALGVPNTRVRFIPLGVTLLRPPESLSMEQRATVLSFASFDGLRVVFVGSLIPLKSVETLLAAQAELLGRGLRVAVLIVGDGPCAPQLRRMAEAAGAGPVVFVGLQPPGLVRAYMRLGHALVLPSMSEGRGLVLVEAMLEGLAVVASDIDGARELVEVGHNGLLFAAGNVAALADRLEQLVREPLLLAELRSNGPEFVHRHDLGMAACADAHIGMYGEVRSRKVST